MYKLVFKRLISPSPSYNERNTIYAPTSLTEEECIKWLSKAKDGVFGIEGIKTPYNETYNLVTPNFFKANWSKSEEDIITGFLKVGSKDATYAQFQLEKPSVFPIDMNLTSSVWDRLKRVCHDDMSIFYQVLVQYRQDNWAERLEEQYDDYLQGVERPSNNATMRKLQRKFSEKIDDFFQWEYKHVPIDEIDTKLQQDGYRFNFKIILIGGIKKRRLRIINQIIKILNSVSYLNSWTHTTLPLTEDLVENLVKRKINSLGRQDVLCLAEVIPFIIHTNEVDAGIELTKTTEVYIQDRPVSVNRNPLLELLPRGLGLPKLDGSHYAPKFIKALTDLIGIEANVTVKRIQYGATLMKMTFDLPKGVKMSQLTRRGTKEDIQLAMGVRHLILEQGDNIGELAVLIPLEVRRKVLLRDYLDTQAFKVFVDSHPLPFLVGVDSVGEPIYRDINKAKHILTGGTTGSGKSTFINQLILTLAMYKSPSDVELYLIDVKQVELTQFRDFPHVKGLITRSSDAIKLLQTLIVEMKHRYSLLEKNAVKNIGIYNYKNPDTKLPYIVCIIDEYAELTVDDKEVHKLVQSISQLARAVGIHLIIATQDPRKEVIPPIIKSNMPSKVAFVCTNENSYMTFLRAKPYYKLLGNGDGVIAFDGQSEDFVRFQSCMIVDDTNNEDAESELIDKIAKALNKKYKDEPKTNTLLSISNDLDDKSQIIIEKTDLEKLKETIIENDETRVGQLREHMRMNIKKLSDLMKQLVDEGFLAEPETRQSGYKLIASEEEIARIRESISQSN